MNECVIHKSLRVSLALLCPINDALGKHFTCRGSLVISSKRIPGFFDDAPCNVESRRQKRSRLRIKGCFSEKRKYRHSHPPTPNVLAAIYMIVMAHS